MRTIFVLTRGIIQGLIILRSFGILILAELIVIYLLSYEVLPNNELLNINKDDSFKIFVIIGIIVLIIDIWIFFTNLFIRKFRNFIKTLFN